MFTRALFVGINHYQTQDGKFGDLKGCVNDVELMRGTLETLGACPEGCSRLILDAAATTDTVLGALDEWITDVRPEERLLLYYSGHGVKVPDLDADEPDGMDEAVVTHDFSKTRPLLDDVLRSYFSRIPDHARAVVIFDCCHSGGLPRAPQSSFGPSREDPGDVRSGAPISRAQYTPAEIHDLAEHKNKFPIERLAENVLVLAACQSDELAWERTLAGRRQGVFTAGLCDTIKRRGLSLPARQVIDGAYAFIRNARRLQTPRMLGREEYFDRPLL